MLERRRLIGAACAAAVFFPLCGPAWSAAGTDAMAIMKAVDDFDDGDHMVADVEMVLTDRQGTRQTKRFHRYMRNGVQPQDKYSYIRFYEPKLIDGIAVLSYDYRDHRQDNDSWIYMPELGKVKRLTSAERTGRLMGSDIAYGDLTRRKLESYDFRLLAEPTVGAWKTWHIEFVPRTAEEIQRFGYLKGHVWVDKQSLRVVRSIFWKAENGQTKLFDVKRLEKVDGIWTPVDMVFAVQQNGATVHHTAMRFSQVQYNKPVPDHLFTPEGLARPVEPGQASAARAKGAVW